jgi:beta-galactosidase
MKTRILVIGVFVSLFLILLNSCTKQELRSRSDFNADWKFYLGDAEQAMTSVFNDSSWRVLNLPHDWSIEGEFSADNPATAGGGALPGGIGWYRKTFNLEEAEKGKLVFIEFDGVYMNSEVWINGQYLGKRPNGYSSFHYELTPYLNYGKENNILAVKVDNSKQPNSRWYSGSGIYRNVWLVKTDPVHIDHWGTSVTTPEVSTEKATVSIKTSISNATESQKEVQLVTSIITADGKKVGSVTSDTLVDAKTTIHFDQVLSIQSPQLWSIEKPILYKAVSEVKSDKKQVDNYSTPFGIRFFAFDAEKGFLLNGEKVKIKGVCNHHDLGCLGSAINYRALERQLEILKAMGCNGIRTSHNPPAPELLDLCDKMGFIVMDEMIDMWKMGKNPYDFSLFWDEWHERDLRDLVLRDRNHPSIFIWSIGNEIAEQWTKEDTTGLPITKELAGIIRSLDTTRPITANWNDPFPHNEMFISDALDLMGYSYQLAQYESFPTNYPGKKFIGSETTSALATRGHYDMPSDSIRRWPIRWDIPFNEGNPDNTVSAYDNVSAPWGSTHEETWKMIKKHDYLSGMYVWTGFDYLGEPTPYGWPSRSSYFGIMDLAGLPKDCYYMYQSEWTTTPVLHVFPHWNWNEGDSIDVLAYFNCEEVELFLNDKSQGVKKKINDDLHVMWRLAYVPGTLKAIGYTGGKEVLTQVINTAGMAAKIKLTADRNVIEADGKDLSFITIDILDEKGNLVPNADNLVNFELEGNAFIAGVDNGSQTSHEPFKANYRKAFNGKCLVVIQSSGKPGKIILKAISNGMQEATVTITAK